MGIATYRERYIRFRSDLYDAVKAGREAEQNEPDTGAANFDCVSLYLYNWKEKEIREAARMAGISVDPCVRNGVKSWLFSPKTDGQGAKRAVNVETMKNVLQRKGYYASVHHQID